MENVRGHRDIKLVTTQRRRNNLVSEPNYHTLFPENLLAIEIKKTQVLMNEPVYSGQSILDLSKTVMYEFWYDYAKPKCDGNANFVIWIQAASLFMQKQDIKILQKMLKNDLTLQILN